MPIITIHQHRCVWCKASFDCPTNEPGDNCPDVCLDCLDKDFDAEEPELGGNMPEYQSGKVLQHPCAGCAVAVVVFESPTGFLSMENEAGRIIAAPTPLLCWKCQVEAIAEYEAMQADARISLRRGDC